MDEAPVPLLSPPRTGYDARVSSSPRPNFFLFRTREVAKKEVRFHGGGVASSTTTPTIPGKAACDGMLGSEGFSESLVVNRGENGRGLCAALVNDPRVVTSFW